MRRWWWPSASRCWRRRFLRLCHSLGVGVAAPEPDAEAEKLASSMDLNRLRRDRGQYTPLPSVEEALAYPYTDSERASIARNRSRLFVGSPATVMAKLQPMITSSQPAQVMCITALYNTHSL